MVVKGETEVKTTFRGTKGQDSAKSRSFTSTAVALKALGRSELPIVIDDFHYLPRDLQRSVVRGLKRPIFDGHQVILIAVPHRSYDAIRVEREMTGRVHSVPIPAWEIPELLQIAREVFPLLNIDASQGVCVALAKETYGSPHLMQEFCRILAQTHNVSETPHSTVTIATIKPELFRSAANSIVREIFHRIAKGSDRPRTRRWLLKSAQNVDIYDLTLCGLSHLSPGFKSVSYPQLRHSLRELVTETLPRKQQLVGVLEQMSSIAAGDEASVPVLD